MTDYEYGDDRVQLTGDSSQNGAASMGGYPLDVRPDGNWPGRSADPNSQKLDTDRMLHLASLIDSYAKTLQGSGVLQIEGDTTVSYGPDRWQAAVYLADASKQVARTVSSYTQLLLENLQGASAAIQAAAAGYSGAENANKHSAANQQGSVDGSTSHKAF
jgi:hypothetical protein